jgi:putative ABC transport system substrate-binding protein
MNRRDLLALLGGTAATCPLGTMAQLNKPTIGFLHAGGADAYRAIVVAFHQGLKDNGYVEGQNVAVEYRWANNDPGRLSALAAELASLKVRVIVSGGGPASALAAKQATSEIPIVLAFGGDPVELGLLTTLNKPDRNITGITFLTSELVSKRLGLLTELIPQASLIGYLRTDLQHSNPLTERLTKDMLAAARVVQRRVMILQVGGSEEFAAAFAKIQNEASDSALIVEAISLFTTNRKTLVALAAHYKVPTMYQSREFVVDGGLISYGASFPSAFREAGVYVARILDGAKIAELPFQQSTKFDLVINLKTARALNITVPPTLLARADEVIE